MLSTEFSYMSLLLSRFYICSLGGK